MNFGILWQESKLIHKSYQGRETFPKWRDGYWIAHWKGSGRFKRLSMICSILPNRKPLILNRKRSTKWWKESCHLSNQIEERKYLFGIVERRGLATGLDRCPPDPAGVDQPDAQCHSSHGEGWDIGFTDLLMERINWTLR